MYDRSQVTKTRVTRATEIVRNPDIPIYDIQEALAAVIMEEEFGEPNPVIEPRHNSRFRKKKRAIDI